MSQTPAPRLAVTGIALSERRVPFRTPFRFGAVTVNEAAQLFVHVAIDVDGKESHGASAELMVPKWFNKNPALSADETVEQLRQSVRIARGLYLDGNRRDTAFGLHAACYPGQVEACAEAGIPALAAAFGPAEIDKAIFDALLRATGQDAFTGFAANAMGLDARLTPDLDQTAIDAFLTGRKPSAQIALRHTVGMIDPLDSVREAVGEGYRYFKLKLCGDPQKDRARLAAIAVALGDADYRATADANEQYRNAADLGLLLDALAEPALAGLAGRLLYIEQPFARDTTWDTPLGALAGRARFIIDEADDRYDAFPRARALGYRGCSTKSCKGVYKSLLNGARAAQWNKTDGDYFISAEDLTCQPGLAVQQDTALVAFHGLGHAERNGHHYVDGFAGTPETEARAFLTAHPDLYSHDGGAIHLKVENGAITTRSLAIPGFASAVAPDEVGPHPSGSPDPTKTHTTEFAS